jgi:hypothetical protein
MMAGVTCPTTFYWIAHRISGVLCFRRMRTFWRKLLDGKEEGAPFSGVIYGHQLSVTIGTCIRNLDFIAKVASPEDIANRVEYLPL